MTMNEKEIERLIFEVFRTELDAAGLSVVHWLIGRVVKQAARAIAEKLAKGVVYEDTFRTEEYQDHVLLLSRTGDAQMRTTDGGFEDGQEYTVTVRRSDGQGAEAHEPEVA